MSNETSKSGGVGVFGLLGVLFIALKLTGYITWSWWLVTLPLWGGVAIVLLLMVLAIILAALQA